MCSGRCHWSSRRVWTLLSGLVVASLLGCAGGGGSDLWDIWGTPYSITRTGGSTSGPGSTGRVPGSGSGSGSTAVEPCAETQARKFVTISMRNYATDYIHYFLVLIAYVDDPATSEVEGAVCSTDVDLYTAAGYTLVAAGSTREFGNFCIVGPALYYFHRAGQFKGAGTTGLAAGIGPAQGTSPTYDGYFGANGHSMPVPDRILFHNPGTSVEARALKFSTSYSAPCSSISIGTIDPDCEQDAFYYVDENDLRAGPALPLDTPSGSSVRFPAQIQGTGCQCGVSNEPWAVLAPVGRTAATAQCNEYFRGGRIDFAFVRDDTEPPYPQLLWRVTDGSNSRVHDFDARARIP
jgi:hypothetical protein